jgi:hypothetical protein
MTTSITITDAQYRLRAGNPMPIASAGSFVIHSFMAETNDIDIHPCATDLPSSSDFRGQGGEFISASFSQLPIQGGNYFQGKVVHNPKYVEESALGFN